MHPCLFGQFNFYPNYSTYSILIRIIPILSKIFNFYSKTFFSLSKLRFALISILYWKFQISLQFSIFLSKFPIFLCENQIIPSKISRCFLKTVSPKKSCKLRCSLLSVCHVQFFFHVICVQHTFGSRLKWTIHFMSRCVVCATNRDEHFELRISISFCSAFTLFSVPCTKILDV